MFTETWVWFVKTCHMLYDVHFLLCNNKLEISTLLVALNLSRTFENKQKKKTALGYTQCYYCNQTLSKHNPGARPSLPSSAWLGRYY